MVSIWIALVELLNEVLHINQVFFRLPSKLVRWVALLVDVVLVSSTATIWATADDCGNLPFCSRVTLCAEYRWRRWLALTF